MAFRTDSGSGDEDCAVVAVGSDILQSDVSN